MFVRGQRSQLACMARQRTYIPKEARLDRDVLHFDRMEGTGQNSKVHREIVCGLVVTVYLVSSVPHHTILSPLS